MVTNAEARFNNSLRPRKSEGSLGRTAQDGHLDSHTAPELMCLIINNVVTVTIMYYSNLQVNYMVTVCIRQLLLLSCSKCFVGLCLFQHCFLVGVQIKVML